ncbi:hypothetical protein NVP1187O_163 [Vibrio phage 1.187.O._10N.286.49.F1]|nr:hypothetical protein NVP1187O_163 [Vibrio phage 1.187.O._10N.286.49.F1]
MYVMDTKIHKSIEPLRDELVNIVYNYLNSSNVKITQNKRLLIKGAVACFLLNTFCKVKKGINLCGITLNRNHYSQCPIVNGVKINRKVSYQYTRVVFDALVSHSMIVLNKGGVQEYGVLEGKWQAISFTNGFVEIKKPLLRMYDCYESLTSEESVRKNVVIVRDGKGIDIPYKGNAKTRIDKGILIPYNVLSIEQIVENGDRIFDVQMYKVYNGNTFQKGARNYMSGEGIQNLSSDERHKLTINGCQTVIYDYKAFEPSIAYSMSNEVMEGDPYTINIDGYCPVLLRKLCKSFLLVMMNIKDRKNLKTSLNSLISSEFNVNTLYKEGKIPDKRIDINTIVDKIETKHYLIKHMFYDNHHTHPSYLGSLIADYITDYFTQRGVLVLSVFDEFIIQEEYDQELKEVMFRAYETILGQSSNCNVRKEK